MRFSRARRAVVAVVIGVAVATVALARAWGFGPFLDIQVVRTLADERLHVYELRMTTRGGEHVDEVRVEPIVGVEVIGGGRSEDLPPDTLFITRVQHRPQDQLPPSVRVIQEARVRRTWDLTLDEEAGR